jgi:hypothetical protein
MLASQSIAAGGNTRSMDDFAEGLLFPEVNKSVSYPTFPFIFKEDYLWAEQVYRSGDMVALVALYKNIPKYLQKDLDQLVAETYRKKLLTVPFLEASLLLLASGVLPEFRSLSRRLKPFCPASCLDFEQHKAIEFVTSRNPDDLVVMVLRSDRLIATMTLFPFYRKQDIPSLSYLEVDATYERLPDVQALEVGRLAKITCNGYGVENSENRFIDMTCMAAAFMVSDRFVSENGLLSDPQSFICGDTHGTLITSLKRFFPLTVFGSRINSDMLLDNNDARGMSIYFIQRQVLGSFESANDLVAAIHKVTKSDAAVAHRILELLESGLKTLGVASIHQFDPKRFRVYFFHFPYHHPDTRKGLARMEQMMHWMTNRPDGLPN